MTSSPAAGELPAAFGPLAAEELPAWLPPVLATLYAGYAGSDGAESAAASRWAQRLAGLLSEPLPFAVVHDWQARTVLPLIAAATGSAGAVEDVRQLHARAAAGERFDAADWRAVLEPALHELYRQAYGYAEAYASAHASASAYARANNFTEQGVVSFAESYAAMSADANRDSFAEANAVANATALAAAYAAGDGQAYAEAYPFALLQACADASVNAAGRAEGDEQPSDPARLRQQAYVRLAEGLADSCARRR